jgi:hypothetical protein
LEEPEPCQTGPISNILLATTHFRADQSIWLHCHKLMEQMWAEVWKYTF